MHKMSNGNLYIIKNDFSEVIANNPERLSLSQYFHGLCSYQLPCKDMPSCENEGFPEKIREMKSLFSHKKRGDTKCLIKYPGIYPPGLFKPYLCDGFVISGLSRKGELETIPGLTFRDVEVEKIVDFNLDWYLANPKKKWRLEEVELFISKGVHRQDCANNFSDLINIVFPDICQIDERILKYERELTTNCLKGFVGEASVWDVPVEEILAQPKRLVQFAASLGLFDHYEAVKIDWSLVVTKRIFNLLWRDINPNFYSFEIISV